MVSVGGGAHRQLTRTAAPDAHGGGRCPLSR
jgi:hypothetical protein